MVYADFLRVSRHSPCPICGRPDWCVTSADGAVAICMRESDGAIRQTRNGGYLHRLKDHNGHRPETPARTIRVVGVEENQPDLSSMAQEFCAAANQTELEGLSDSLGLSTNSLRRLNIGWSALHSAWSFPMTNVRGQVLGIRLRSRNGRKFAVKGGRDGLFIPRDQPDASSDRLVICEGPTDTAAMLDLGFPHAVGRPNCLGGVALLTDLAKARKPARAVIAADGDEPGRRGADSLAGILVGYVPEVRIIHPPETIKDVRDWLRHGATKEDVEQSIQAAQVLQLSVRLAGAADPGG